MKEIKEIFFKEGYTLISNEYKNNKQKLEVLCPEGHTWFIRLDVFITGNRCLDCSGKKRNSYEYVKRKIEEIKGYKLLSVEYKNARTKLKIMCDKGHTFYMAYGNFQHLKQRCPTCVTSSSHGEKEMAKYISEIYNGKIVTNDRKTLKNPSTKYYLELDVYLPDENKAIEYGAKHWHKDEIREKLKDHLCSEKNIELLRIEHLEWQKNKKICINTINNFLGVII